MSRPGFDLSFLAPALILLLTACASGPHEAHRDRAVVEGTLSDGFDCAMREVNDRGFVVDSADRASGFLRAERNGTGLMDSLLGGIRVLDAVTVVVFEDGAGRTVMRVTPARTEIQVRGEDRGNRLDRPASSDGRTAAREILEACGQPVGV
jgi:hypothetical protein